MEIFHSLINSHFPAGTMFSFTLTENTTHMCLWVYFYYHQAIHSVLLLACLDTIHRDCYQGNMLTMTIDWSIFIRLERKYEQRIKCPVITGMWTDNGVMECFVLLVSINHCSFLQYGISMSSRTEDKLINIFSKDEYADSPFNREWDFLCALQCRHRYLMIC